MISNTQILGCINRLLQSGLSFALYRLPDTEEVHLVMQTEGDAQPLNAEEQEPTGFVIAPFHECKTHPTLIIHPDVWVTGWEEILHHTQHLPKTGRIPLDRLPAPRTDYASPEDSWMYKERYKQAMWQIQQERFEKVVISYCEDRSYPGLNGYEADIYVRALDQFPHSFVHLFYTPTSGRWMGCSPELLLHRNGEDWNTVALAGTHAWGDREWDTKNIHEQDVVTRYVNSTLTNLGAEVKCGNTHTVQAGPLMHLRTDFEFRLPTTTNTLDVARTLHPTPAVCGMPKEETFRYLQKCEKVSRNYYTGYLGPMNRSGETHLYVNLRCAQIRSKKTLYYAGGGLTALSLLWEEQREISRKLSVLKDMVYEYHR